MCSLPPNPERKIRKQDDAEIWRTVDALHGGWISRHLAVAKRVLRYLKKTGDWKLACAGPNQNLHGFVDADRANSADRKPQSLVALL